MKAIRPFVWLFPLALVSSGCNGGAEGATPGATAPSAVATTTDAAPQGERGEHGADPTNALLQATDGLQLTDAQKATIHSLEEQLEANEKDTGAAFKALRSDLAAQVRAGAIDQAKVQADEGAAATALQAHIAKEADTINGLHAALDPSQRKAAVAAVRARQSGRAEAQPGARNAASSEDIAKRRLAHLTRELGLDDAQQQQQVASLLAAQPAPKEPRMEERQHRMDVLLTAFEADTFDAKTAVPAPAVSPADTIREGTDREVAFLSKLLPILKPDQRDKLATSMETRGMRDHDDD
jgi:hypothetical protein